MVSENWKYTEMHSINNIVSEWKRLYIETREKSGESKRENNFFVPSGANSFFLDLSQELKL